MIRPSALLGAAADTSLPKVGHVWTSLLENEDYLEGAQLLRTGHSSLDNDISMVSGQALGKPADVAKGDARPTSWRTPP